jgi:hypothetical protein
VRRRRRKRTREEEEGRRMREREEHSQLPVLGIQFLQRPNFFHLHVMHINLLFLWNKFWPFFSHLSRVPIVDSPEFMSHHCHLIFTRKIISLRLSVCHKITFT